MRSFDHGSDLESKESATQSKVTFCLHPPVAQAEPILSRFNHKELKSAWIWVAGC